ncbi:MAG: hydroxymethylbilane synthase [Bdellovibrionales bacterium]|nr:hydroxymethylbilane synthase [Bdellovibrionales bacterium]
MRYRLGTRESDLALTQSRWVQSKLEALGVLCDLVPIVSRGDRDQKTALYEAEASAPGWFTKQLEIALQDGSIDLAVHSLKDLPTLQPPGQTLACIPERRNPADCLLVHPDAWEEGGTLPLRKGARVGTSSLRREALLLCERGDLDVQPIRGNLPTRLAKLRKREFDAVVFAEAGLERLAADTKDLRHVSLAPTRFVPAPGQGALGVEVREDAPAVLQAALGHLHNAQAAAETRLERHILRELEGGCTLPLGVLCTHQGAVLKIMAFLGKKLENQAGHSWTGFLRFDISGSDEQYLVAETLKYFRKGT